MIKPRQWIIGSLLALGIALPLGVAAVLSWDERPTQRLADGATLRLSGVRYGPASQLALGPPWKRRLFPLASILPGPLVDRIGWDVRDLSSYTSPESLLVATEVEPARGESTQFGNLIDSHGCRFMPLNRLPWNDGESDLNVDCFPFFPRREPGSRLELFLPESSITAPAATFFLGNPLDTRHPVWVPDALPATRSRGVLTATLLGATVREASTPPATRRDGPDLQLRFQDSPSSAGWMPIGLTITDAGGGFYRFGTTRKRLDPHSFTARVGLCRMEPAYQCKVEFTRIYQAGAQPDQIDNLGTWDVDRLSAANLTLQDKRPVLLEAVPIGHGVWLRLSWMPATRELGRLIVNDTAGHVFESDPPSPAAVGHSTTPGVFIPKGIKRLQVRFGTFNTEVVTFQVKPQPVAR